MQYPVPLNLPAPILAPRRRRRRRALLALGWLCVVAARAAPLDEPPPPAVDASPPMAAVAGSAPRSATTGAAAREAVVEPGWRLREVVDLLEVEPVMTLERPAAMRADDVRPGLFTLGDALELGAGFNLDARISQAQEAQQLATRRGAWRQLGPKIDLRYAAGHGKFESVSGPTPGMSRGDASVTLRMPIFDWSTWQDILRQEQNAEASSLTRGNAQSLAALEAGNGYLGVLQSRLVVGYTEQYEELLRRLLRYMEDRADAGGASPADFDRVRARVENTRSAVSENRAGLVTSLAEFARLTGLIPETIEVPAMPEGELPGDAQAAIDAALEENLDLRAARSLAEATGRERRAVDGRFMPRLDLELSATENRNPSGSVGEQSDQSALVIMSWNVFNSGADLAQRVAVAAREQEFVLRVENAERQLRQQLETSYSVLDSIRLQVAAVREEVRANRTVVEAFSEQLFATNRQLLDVLDAYQRYFQSKVDFTNLLVTEARLKLQVAHLLGRLRRYEAPARR